MNVTAPVGLVAPDSVAVSVIGLPTTESVALVLSCVQLLMLTCCGGTKSLSSVVNVFDARLLRYAEPNEPHAFPLNSALKEIDASPKVSASRVPSPPLSSAGIVSVLIDPSACELRPPLMTDPRPQLLPFQVKMLIVGTVPPLASS